MADVRELKWSKIDRPLSAEEKDVFRQVEDGPQVSTGFIFRSQHPTEAIVITAHPSLRNEVTRYAGEGALVHDAVVSVSELGVMQVGINEGGKQHLFGTVFDDRRPAVAVGKGATQHFVSLGLWVPEAGELVLPTQGAVVESAVEIAELGSMDRFANVPVVELPD